MRVQNRIISTHGIAMPKGSYFTAVVFSFFDAYSLGSLNAFQPNLDTYSLMTAIRKIWSELPGHLTPTGWGQKRFLEPTLNFDRTYLCNGT